MKIKDILSFSEYPAQNNDTALFFPTQSGFPPPSRVFPHPVGFYMKQIF